MLDFTGSEMKHSIKMIFLGACVWTEIILSDAKYLDSYHNLNF